MIRFTAKFLINFVLFSIFQREPNYSAVVRGEQRKLQGQDVFVNEIHYDNDGSDQGEFVEVAYPTGLDVSSYSLVLYRGKNGKMYKERHYFPTFSCGGDSNGLSFCYISITGIRNGNYNGDAIAVVGNNDAVLQFIGYETDAGTVAAVDGPAAGMTPVDIGIEQDPSSSIGHSIQLVGTGCTYSDFSWQAESIVDTRGEVNTGQTVNCSPPTTAPTTAAPTTSSPTDRPSDKPSMSPSDVSSSSPSDVPTVTASDPPSAVASDAPSDMPTTTASHPPSTVPSDAPSDMPTLTASDPPSAVSSDAPSDMPTMTASDPPSAVVSDAPSDVPTATASDPPSAVPSDAPSDMPTAKASDPPSAVPSDAPTPDPTSAPTTAPPTPSPTVQVTTENPVLPVTPFVNEIIYDNNDGTDVGEFIEVAYPTALDASLYSIVLYRGKNGKMYKDRYYFSTFTCGGDSNGMSFCFVSITGIRNGNDNGDAIAVVDPNDTVLQFIGYEIDGGTVAAVNGPAAGMFPVDIGIEQDPSSSIGHSLQLIGNGCNYIDFSWHPESIVDTRGEINTGQTISCSLPTPPPTPVSSTTNDPTPQGTTIPPTPNPTDSSGGDFPSLGFPELLDDTGTCTPATPCERCEGDCANDDSNCRSDLGLTCFVRSANEQVAGCVSGGSGDVSGVDYCYEAPANGPVTYVPGDLTVYENGLILSTGLTSNVIATTGSPVLYGGGGQSGDDFHVDPDGAAVFVDSVTGNYKYVSNAESTNHGGVGSITFDSSGVVLDYEVLADSAVTKRNCGGGKTFWNTWLTCEETPGGQVLEIDPWGVYPPRTTIIGGVNGDEFESAAYDNRDPVNVKFYITADRDAGPLYRFTPDVEAVRIAMTTNNYTDLLHTDPNGTAKVEYLVLSPNPSNEDEGTFSWTDQLHVAELNAFVEYRRPEGIDIRDGIVYFTCKKDRELFILDLDNGTYERDSTDSGAFDNKPDQVARLLEGDTSILYFCEDKRAGVNSVHGRDSMGNYYTIFENLNTTLYGETTGLAFSPDSMRMYVSYQSPGVIMEISRTDGYPFDGQRLDIKYHADPDNLFVRNET